MVTIHQSVKSLLNAIALKLDEDFHNLGVKNYGFQAPGLLDPRKNRSGYKLQGAIGINNRDKPITVPVLLGKIAPITSPSELSDESICLFGHRVGLEVCHWQECEAIGLSQSPEEFSVRFEYQRDQDRNIAGNNKDAWWWVMRWQFDLVGYFDA